jgi:GMP synthase-like glutamine amidotransferase
MQKEVLIFLHMDDQHPGYIADYLTRKNIPYRIIRSYKQEPIPVLDDSMAGLVFMGGAMSANDKIDWLKDEINLIEQAIDKAVPLLGHCLGGQLISKALGQPISKNPVPEVGWHQCYRANTENAGDWLGDSEDPFIMFHWHFETFAIPANAELLFCSAHCKNQAYSYGNNVLAIQSHVEMTGPLLTDWINQWKAELRNISVSEQDYVQIKENLVENISALNRVADNLYGRWITTL